MCFILNVCFFTLQGEHGESNAPTHLRTVPAPAIRRLGHRGETKGPHGATTRYVCVDALQHHQIAINL